MKNNNFYITLLAAFWIMAVSIVVIWFSLFMLNGQFQGYWECEEWELEGRTLTSSWLEVKCYLENTTENECEYTKKYIYIFGENFCTREKWVRDI